MGVPLTKGQNGLRRLAGLLELLLDGHHLLPGAIDRFEKRYTRLGRL
jgi:hypothetical protein